MDGSNKKETQNSSNYRVWPLQEEVCHRASTGCLEQQKPFDRQGQGGTEVDKGTEATEGTEGERQGQQGKRGTEGTEDQGTSETVMPLSVKPYNK